MLKFRESVLILLVFFSFLFAKEEKTEYTDNDTKRYQSIFTEEELKRLKKQYQIAVDMFKKGSYYSAIESVYPVLLKPENPYYPYGLFLMSKIYLHIGKKTGKKDFIVKALYFLNTYLYTSKDATDHWDFYYTRGSIYENLFQYERALSDYKISYLKAKTPEEQFKSLISLLRTAAWTKKLDIATRYLILVNLEELSKKEKHEFLFVKGLLAFKQGRYKEAFENLSKVYKEYEQLLIDNPYYYLIVAETAYRYGKLKFSQQLFRRIISTIKDPFIIRQALLRLGDIELKLKHPVYAFNYYYSIIEKYPESQEAKIAKLKILSAGEKFPKIKEKIILLKKKDEDFEKPFRFVFKMWISNRNNYLGDFALGNLGYLVLGINSEKLFKKLLWELSLVSPSSLKYEHIEYIKNLWERPLLQLDNRKVCQLYTTNPSFFKKVFSYDRTVMKKILFSLFVCGKTDEEVDLAKFLNSKWKDKEAKLLLAKSYLDNKEYKKAVNLLKNIKDSSCDYYKIKVQASLLIGVKPDVSMSKMENACKNNLEAKVYQGLAYYISGDKKKALKILTSIKDLYSFYSKDPFVKESIRKLLDDFISQKNYKNAYLLAKSLGEKDCYILSVSLIASVRLKKEKEAEKLYSKIKNCSIKLSQIAKNIYKDFTLLKEMR